MRGVAYQRQPFADERARHEITERKRPRFVQRLDLAEMQAEALPRVRREIRPRSRATMRAASVRFSA